MEPIPETTEALEELGPFAGDAIHDQLVNTARAVIDLIPSCVGLSLAVYEYDLTFTLEATHQDVRALDAVQYLDGGPCVVAAEGEEVVAITDTSALMDEADWRLFAETAHHLGIRSTLTIPLEADGTVGGTVNLYASEPGAFDGKHDDVAALVGGWAPGVVTNADLSFSTRQLAEEAPARLAAEALVQEALRLLSTARPLSPEDALRLLTQAAARSGLEVREIARIIVALRDTPEP